MIYVWLQNYSHPPALQKKQRSGVQLSEELVSLDIIGAAIEGPQKFLKNYSTFVLKGLMVSQLVLHYAERRQSLGQPI